MDKLHVSNEIHFVTIFNKIKKNENIFCSFFFNFFAILMPNF